MLTGMANFLIDYPKVQSAAANMSATDFTDLLRTFARTHTQSNAANGTRREPASAPEASKNQPWVGEGFKIITLGGRGVPWRD